MKNKLIKVLSLVMALTMLVGTFSTISFAADCDHANATSEVVEPTCKEWGKTWHECPDCNTKWADTLVPPSADHTGLTEVEASEPDCTNPGYTAGVYCADCGVDEDGNVLVWLEGHEVSEENPNPNGHKFAGSYVRVEPTCTEDGSVTYVCKVCEITYEDALEADEVEVNADYEKHVLPAVGSHDWVVTAITAPSKVSEDAAATCVDGKIEEACKACGEKREVVIEADHKYVAFTNEAYACVEYTSGKECEICGKLTDLVPNDDATEGHKFEQVTALSNAVINMGYTTPNSLKKNPTCTADGWYLAQCTVCGEYAKLTGEDAGDEWVAGHNWSAFTKEENANETWAAGYCEPSYYAIRKCQTAGCKAEEKVIIREAVKHDLKTATTPASCGAFGSVVTYCANVDCSGTNRQVVFIDIDNDGENDNTVAYHVTYSVATPSLNHKWSAWTNPEAGYDCTDGFVRERECANCGAVEYDNTTYAATSHAWTTGSDVVVVDATCVLPAYNAYYCTNPYCSATTPAEYNDDSSIKTIDDVKSEDNHVYELVIVNEADNNRTVTGCTNGTWLGVTKQATCTATGTAKLICACGDELVVTIPAYEHVESTEGAHYWIKDGKYYASKVDGAKEIDLRAVATSCVEAGKTAGVGCVYCGVVLEAQEVVALDPDAHTFTTTDPISTVAATCVNKEYETYFCELCHEVVKVVTGAEYGNCERDPEASKTFKAPTCGAAGNHEYDVCKYCKQIMEVRVVDLETGELCAECVASGDGYCTDPDHAKIYVNQNYVIPALPHDYEDMDAVPETCDKPGFTAYKKCTICGTETGKAVVPAHGDKYTEKVVAVDATCYTDGIVIKSGAASVVACTKCAVKTGEDDTDYLFEVVSAINHANMTTTTTVVFGQYDAYGVKVALLNNDYDCTTADVTVKACPDCGLLVASNYTVGKAKHNYELNWHKVVAGTGENANRVFDGTTDLGYICTIPTYEYRACTVCGSQDMRNVNAPVAHYYVDGDNKVEISLSCADIEEFVGRKCEICKHEVVVDGGAGTLSVNHVWVDYEQNATCEAAGFEGKLCNVCGETKDVVVRPAKNPTLIPFINDKGEFDNKAPVIDATVVEKVLVHNAATSANEGYIKYICKLCGEDHEFTYDALEEATFKFDVVDTVVTAGGQVVVNVAITANKYTFQNIEIEITHNSGLKIAENGVVVNYDFGDVLVDKKANTQNNVSVDNILRGVTELVLWATTGADGKAQTATVTGDETAFVTLTFDVLPNAYGPAFIKNVAGEIVVDVKVSYVNKDGDTQYKDVIIESSDEIKDYMIGFKGDANGDATLDVADVNAIIEAVYAQSDDANLDFNNDGIVDIDDHFAFMNYYTVFNPTVYDYFTLIGVDVKAAVDAFTVTADLNGDKVIDAADKDVLYTFVVIVLKDASAEDLDNAPTIEKIIDNVYTNLVVGSYS